jgi:glycosyltransferase involved in cell wall biosynthesis
MMPRVSIGLPVYNGEVFLDDTLDSLLAQTFENFELIISDNASTDRTEAICRDYAARDARIRYERNAHNLGAAQNFNRTVACARGPYFKWAAHDDLCAPEFLQRCVEVLDRDPNVILCYAREVWIDQQSQPLSRHADLLNFRAPTPAQRFKALHDVWYRRGYLHANQCFGLMRTEALRQTSLIGRYVWSELVLAGELLLRGEFYEVPEYLFFFRCHDQTSRAVRQASNFRGLAVWFDPANRDKIVLPHWRLLRQYLLAIQHAPIGWREKTACHLQMLRWVSWKWKRLARELLIAERR